VSFSCACMCGTTRDVIQKTTRKVCLTRSLLLVVVARVLAVAVLAGQTKRRTLCCSGSEDIPINPIPN